MPSCKALSSQEVSMRKSIQKPNTIAPLTARASTQSTQSSAPAEPRREVEPRREPAANPWLSHQVTQRLDEGRALLIDMATDLPFASVLRGRVAPPRTEVLAQAEPMAKVMDHFKAQLPPLGIDATYVRERYALIERLGAFEEAGENFLGLIRRTKAVMAAQLEKAMRGAFEAAAQAATGNPELERALKPLHPVLGEAAQKPRRR
jgi:hypothetical protein